MVRWRETLLRISESAEREWLGLARPHPSRLIDGFGRCRPFIPDRPREQYCLRCGGTVGGGEYVEGAGCGACRRRRYPWTQIVRLGRYDADLREWVHEIKFHAWDAMGYELGRRLGGTLVDLQVRADAVVPVPASTWRRWRRGVDHSHCIANGVAAALGIPVVRAMKREARPPQRAVAPSRRRDNVRGAFRVKRLSPLRHCRVVLVDDVTTTRATLLEAANTLRRRAGVEAIVAAVLTVAESDRSAANQTGATETVMAARRAVD